MGAELTRQRPDRREQFDVMNETPALAKDEIHAPWQQLMAPTSGLPPLPR